MSDSEPAQQSLFSWIFAALGFPYLVLLLVTGFLSFLFALGPRPPGKRTDGGRALVLAVHMPFFVGVFAAIHGLLSAYTVIARSGTTPKPAEVAVGISTALVAPLFGMLLMVPSYMTGMIGAFVRSMSSRSKDN